MPDKTDETTDRVPWDIKSDDFRHVDRVFEWAFWVGRGAVALWGVVTIGMIALAVAKAAHWMDTDVTVFGICAAAVGGTAAIGTFFLKVAVDTNLRREEIADDVVGVLRGCWDELRSDGDLRHLLEKTATLTPGERFQVRSFLARVADAYSMVVYYTEHGYFGKEKAIYEEVYQNTFKTLLANRHTLHHMEDIWHGTGAWDGEGMAEEYETPCRTAITRILKEAKSSANRAVP